MSDVPKFTPASHAFRTNDGSKEAVPAPAKGTGKGTAADKGSGGYMCFGKTLSDRKSDLADKVAFNDFVAWRQEYLDWKAPRALNSASDTAVLEILVSESDRDTAWRDDYRRWREGQFRGARGETATAVARPLQGLHCPPPDALTEVSESAPPTDLDSDSSRVPAVIFDVVVMDAVGDPTLVPVDGPAVSGIPVRSFPPEALVTIRTFRFFEDRSDEKQVWEQELKNVNSGSLVFLPVHMAPGLHSLKGAKYGQWFTIHYIQVYVKHFSSSYFMAEDGSAYPAKSFGATNATTSTVSGKKLEHGYFWYVSPSREHASLQEDGWQHLYRAGPFDGAAFLEQWRENDSPMEARELQKVLNLITSD